MCFFMKNPCFKNPHLNPQNSILNNLALSALTLVNHCSKLWEIMEALFDRCQ